jgi:hypothetical protein
MARQIDYLNVYLHIARKEDGTYEKRIQAVATCVSDPNPASGKDVDKTPIVTGNPFGITFDGTKTLAAFLDEALAAAADGSGVTLFSGSVINRTTYEYKVGVDSAAYDTGAWLRDPDVSALSAVQKKYWKVSGDTVVEMDSSEKATVDGSAIGGIKSGKIGGLKLQVTGYIGKHYDEGQQATINGLWNEANSNGWTNRQALCQQVMTWIDSVLTHFYAKVDEVLAATTAESVNAVTMDLAQFDASDPHVSMKVVKNTKN